MPELIEASIPPEIPAGADCAARPYAEVSDYVGLLTAIRRRIVELDTAHERIGAVAGIADGYLSKLVCDPPMKYFGAFTMFLVLRSLGLRIALIHDPEALAQVKSRLIHRPPRFAKPHKRKERRQSRRARMRRARWEQVTNGSAPQAV